VNFVWPMSLDGQDAKEEGNTMSTVEQNKQGPIVNRRMLEYTVDLRNHLYLENIKMEMEHKS